MASTLKCLTADYRVAPKYISQAQKRFQGVYNQLAQNNSLSSLNVQNRPGKVGNYGQSKIFFGNDGSVYFLNKGDAVNYANPNVPICIDNEFKPVLPAGSIKMEQ